MKILIYSPYLDTIGGGEQYLLNFAQCMAPRHEVTFVWKDSQTLQKMAKRFQAPISKFKLVPFLPSRKQLRKFDFLFFVSDGSVPFLPFPRSILLFMSPFTNVGGRSPLNQIKLKFINQVVCFSKYTKQLIDQEFSVNSTLIYPAVNIPKVSRKKQNIILSVGRFSNTLHIKNHSILIKTFVNLESRLSDWRLVIVGGTESGSKTLLTQLRSEAKNHRISIRADISTSSLNELYSQVSIYWHAAGFGEDLERSPQKAEHFGISIVEAMGQGAVPVVYGRGGPKEIVTKSSGIVWNSTSELKEATIKIANNQLLRTRLSKGARARAKFFNPSTFCKNFNEIIEK